jgi:hypothetical protein
MLGHVSFADFVELLPELNKVNAACFLFLMIHGAGLMHLNYFVSHDIYFPNSSLAGRTMAVMLFASLLMLVRYAK